MPLWLRTLGLDAPSHHAMCVHVIQSLVNCNLLAITAISRDATTFIYTIYNVYSLFWTLVMVTPLSLL